MTGQTNSTAPRPARVEAIDPGSVKAGMVVLQIQPLPPGFIVPAADAVAVLAARTARPRLAQDFAGRMSELLDITEQWTEEVRRNWHPDLWCIEDPRDFPSKRLSARGTIISLGAAFGVACAAFSVAANRCGVDVTLAHLGRALRVRAIVAVGAPLVAERDVHVEIERPGRRGPIQGRQIIRHVLGLPARVWGIVRDEMRADLGPGRQQNGCGDLLELGDGVTG